MNTNIEKYRVVKTDSHTCVGCCFDGGDDGCLLDEHIALSDALLNRDGGCYDGVFIYEFIYEEIN